MLNHRWKRKTTQLYMYAALTLHTHKISFIFNPYSVPQLFWRHVFVAFDTCSLFVIFCDTHVPGGFSLYNFGTDHIRNWFKDKKENMCLFLPASMTNSSKLSFWLSHPSTDSVTGAFFPSFSISPSKLTAFSSFIAPNPFQTGCFQPITKIWTSIWDYHPTCMDGKQNIWNS